MPLLELRDLRVDFGTTRVVDGVSFDVEAGQILGLVGESGSGKSVTALSLARLLPVPPARYAGGEIRLAGRDILRLGDRELRGVRGGTVSYVFQEPGASLHPTLRVETQLLEALRLHRPQDATRSEVVRLLAGVGIPAPERRARDFAHQLSGGMQQRVMIALALATRPRLLVADEPTTALDVTIQAQILDLLREVRRETGMAMLLISHNLGLVGQIADRMAVMYAGQIVETGPTRDVLQRPRHPYTRALVQSVPALGRIVERLPAIPGAVPVPGAWPVGCRFAPRCAVARPECARDVPVLPPPKDERAVRCPFAVAEPEPVPMPVVGPP